VALWVSASRIRDFAHSAGDVSGGLLLGGAFGALLLARTRALDAQLRAEAASTS
jgi:membrane-associated phospholipid phosphatase